MLPSVWLIIVCVLGVLAAAVAVIALVWCLYAHVRQEYYLAYDTPDHSGEAGFYFAAWPRGELLAPQRFWLIDRRTAEIEYRVTPGKTARLRAAKSGRLQIPDDYRNADYEHTATVEMDGTSVTLRHSPAQPSMATWTRDGFDYALMMPAPEMNMLNGVTNEFVVSAHAVREG